MAKKNGQSGPKGELVKEVILVPLTDSERDSLHMKQTQLYLLVERKKADFKELQKMWKSSISKLEVDLHTTVHTLETGMVEKEMTATKVIDGDVVNYFVGGEVIFSRIATDLDRQSKFPFAKKVKFEDDFPDMKTRATGERPEANA